MSKIIYRRGVAPAEQQQSSSSSSESDEEVQQKVVVDRRLERLAADNATERSRTRHTENTVTEEVEYSRRRTVQNQVVKKIVVQTEKSFIINHTPKAELSESSEDTSDSESEEEIRYPVLMKPVFVKKYCKLSRTERETIQDQDHIANGILLQKEKELLEAEKRKQESCEMVVNALQKAELKQENTVDDTDNIDEELEFQQWKLRELLRIKRDKEQREYRLVDNEDVERRRLMSDAEIAQENVNDGVLGVEKQKMKFLQKYYHKGAFYTDDNEVSDALKKTNALEPTLEDHQDKTTLPSILQVKNFGKHGRTKYTHLVDQDTTTLDSPWAKDSSMVPKLGGIKPSNVKKRRVE
jgi:microfibrillar-associated protein 1